MTSALKPPSLLREPVLPNREDWTVDDLASLPFPITVDVEALTAIRDDLEPAEMES